MENASLSDKLEILLEKKYDRENKRGSSEKRIWVEANLKELLPKPHNYINSFIESEKRQNDKYNKHK